MEYTKLNTELEIALFFIDNPYCKILYISSFEEWDDFKNRFRKIVNGPSSIFKFKDGRIYLENRKDNWFIKGCRPEIEGVMGFCAKKIGVYLSDNISRKEYLEIVKYFGLFGLFGENK